MGFKDFLFEDYNQAEALKKIEGLLPEFIRHILKVKCYPEHRDFYHWLSEIKRWARKINDFSDVKTKFGRIRKSTFQKEFKKKLSSNRLESELNDIIDDYGFTDYIGIANIQNIMCKFFELLENDSYDWENFKSCIKEF